MTPLVPPLPPPLGGDSSDKSAPPPKEPLPNKTRGELGMERPIRSFTPAPCQRLISTLIFPNVGIAVEEGKSQAAPGYWELPTTRAGFQGPDGVSKSITQKFSLQAISRRAGP